MKVYVVVNDLGQCFAADGEGYTAMKKHTAMFLSKAAAEACAEAGENDRVVKFESAGLTRDLSTDDALRLVWNTALMAERQYADPGHELWVAP